MRAKDVKIALLELGVSHLELAERMGISSQNLTNKLKRDDLKRSDIEAIAEALDVEYVSRFELKK